MAQHLDPGLAQRLAGIEDIVLETRRANGDTRRTPVWVVVVDGAAYVRSWHGTRGAWYRDLVREPDVVLQVEGDSIPIRAVPVQDPDVIQRVSDGYLQKYTFSAYARQYAGEMVLAPTLPTTTRLEPRTESA